MVAEATRAATTRPIVMRRKRSGVSHAHCRVASQLRVVLAPAAAVIAPIMHCMHIAHQYASALSTTAIRS